jgi:hypothetical protein
VVVFLRPLAAAETAASVTSGLSAICCVDTKIEKSVSLQELSLDCVPVAHTAWNTQQAHGTVPRAVTVRTWTIGRPFESPNPNTFPNRMQHPKWVEDGATFTAGHVLAERAHHTRTQPRSAGSDLKDTSDSSPGSH